MRVVILTGAGISAESGIKTFRDSGGLWEDHDVMAVASPEGFGRDPGLVHRFYDQRRRQAQEVEPNAAHHALARLERELDGEVLVVTQNVDDLHERAGSTAVLHMHGELLKARCLACGEVHDWREDLAHGPPCPACSETRLRPHIVWFGEVPFHMHDIYEAVGRSDVFVAIGTSGKVHPAAGLVVVAAEAGARTVELNLEASGNGRWFDEVREGPATLTVPDWVAGLLG